MMKSLTVVSKMELQLRKSLAPCPVCQFKSAGCSHRNSSTALLHPVYANVQRTVHRPTTPQPAAHPNSSYSKQQLTRVNASERVRKTPASINNSNCSIANNTSRRPRCHPMRPTRCREDVHEYDFSVARGTTTTFGESNNLPLLHLIITLTTTLPPIAS